PRLAGGELGQLDGELRVPRLQLRQVRRPALLGGLQVGDQHLLQAPLAIRSLAVLAGHDTLSWPPDSRSRSFFSPRNSSCATAPLLRPICQAASASEHPFKWCSSTACR